MVLLAHVSTALGAGKITGLTLNPPDVKTCTFETITVRGTGKCSDVTVFFGDGNKLITLGKPKPFPQTFHHVYSKGGAYQVVGASLHGSGQHLHWQGQQNGADSCGPEPDDHVDVHLGLFLLVGCHAWRADHSTGGEFRRSARTGVDSFERLSRQCQRSSAVGYSEVLARHLRGGDCS